MKYVAFMFACLIGTIAIAQEKPSKEESKNEGKLYAVATAHLDTQWRWTIQDSINDYVPKTLRNNFDLFEKFPDYIFSWECAYHYMLAKEYYPQEYARIKKYVAEGRWAVAGSALVAGDTNTVSPESLIRQYLYGNGFFKREFGKTSVDVFLPDCFGFGYALPTIAKHCGLKGFSTQKLEWGSSAGIPFDIGAWEGVDGSTIIAAINPGGYGSQIRDDLSKSKEWLAKINNLGEKSGVYAGYKYFGTGDTGGSPDERSVKMLEKAIQGDGPIQVISAPSDKLYRDLTPDEIARLPHYKGELLLTTHGTGCYTSQAAMKRWNRKNELLADSAERASVVADWLGGASYPKDKFTEAWIRFLWHHHHDDLTGTSIPQAYEFSWNDEVIALNQFSEVLKDGVGAVARGLDTQVQGTPVVVYNPLSIEREDAVNVKLQSNAKTLRVYAPDGSETPSQIISKDENNVELLFLAKVSSVGFTVYDVRPANEPCSINSGLKITESSLENGRYKVSIDENGDVSSIADKANGKELLDKPIRLELLNDFSPVWPAWEVTYKTVSDKPRGYVGAPAKVRIVENGPVRVSLEVTREADGSIFRQYIRLYAGGEQVEFDTRINWGTKGTLLKAVFPMSVSNEKATYDLGVGTIQRGNNTEKLYEVPAQQWAAITNADGSYGVSVLSESKYGWDKPNDNTLRLTLLHTPTPQNYPDQATIDIGSHSMTYAIYSHKGDWRDGNVAWQAARLNQPLVAFQTSQHIGNLGKSFSLFSVSTPQVAVCALKKAEEGDKLVIRFRELYGKPADKVNLKFAIPIIEAEELNGSEDAIGKVALQDGKIVFNMLPYSLRTFSIKLASLSAKFAAPVCKAVSIPLEIDATSGDLDGKGHSLPAELLPKTITSEGISFDVSEKKALACDGQKINLPEGKFNRLYILACAIDGDQKGAFAIGDKEVELIIGDFTNKIGQWYNRMVGGKFVTDISKIEPAFIKRGSIAWVGTHRRNKEGKNEACVYCYLFKYKIDLPEGTATLTLPKNGKIRIFALTAAQNVNDDTQPVQPLYDEFYTSAVSISGNFNFIDSATIAMTPYLENAEIRYTLDGYEPIEKSILYTAPFKVANSVIVKAKAFKKGMAGDGYISTATFTKVKPRQPENPADVVNGVHFDYYEGSWQMLPDFGKLEPDNYGIAREISLAPSKRDEDFALKFTGFVDIPKEGIYTFYTTSDDGSKLYIGNTEVVNNDGLHGNVEESGTIALAAGKHAFTVTFFQLGGDESLEVRYEGPCIQKQRIPVSELWCKK